MRRPLGKWLEIEERLSASGKTKLLALFPVGQPKPVAFVGWYGPWRKYALQPEPGTVFEVDCLAAITALLNEETTAHRKARADARLAAALTGRPE